MAWRVQAESAGQRVGRALTGGVRGGDEPRVTYEPARRPALLTKVPLGTLYGLFENWLTWAWAGVAFLRLCDCLG